MNQEITHTGIRSMKALNREACSTAHENKTNGENKNSVKNPKKWGMFFKLFFFSNCCSFHRAVWEISSAPLESLLH